MQTRVTVRNGKIEMVAVGGKGDECRQKHAPYLKALGLDGDKVDEQLLPEFYEARQDETLLQQQPDLEQQG